MKLKILSTDPAVLSEAERFFREASEYSGFSVIASDETSTTVEVSDKLDFKMSGLLSVVGVKVLIVKSEELAAATRHDEPLTIADYTPIVDEIMHRKANQYGYDNIISACSYATSTIPRFYDEGRAFAKWRDLIWTSCFAMAAEAEASGIWPDPASAAALLPVYEDVLAGIDA